MKTINYNGESFNLISTNSYFGGNFWLNGVGYYCPQVPPFSTIHVDGRELSVVDENYGEISFYQGRFLDIFFESSKYMAWQARIENREFNLYEEESHGFLYKGTLSELEEYMKYSPYYRFEIEVED